MYRILLTASAVALLWLQIQAYDASVLRATEPAYCQLWGFGACGDIMASGWATLLNGTGLSMNLEGALARGVPLLMIWSAALASFGPRQFWVTDGQRRRITPSLLLWLAVLMLLLLVSVWVLEARTGPVVAP